MFFIRCRADRNAFAGFSPFQKVRSGIGKLRAGTHPVFDSFNIDAEIVFLLLWVIPAEDFEEATRCREAGIGYHNAVKRLFDGAHST